MVCETLLSSAPSLRDTVPSVELVTLYPVMAFLYTFEVTIYCQAFPLDMDNHPYGEIHYGFTGVRLGDDEIA